MSDHDLAAILRRLDGLSQEVATVAGRYEAKAEITDVLMAEVRDRLSRLSCEAHAEALRQASERMDRLRSDISELQARPPRPPTGEIEQAASTAVDEITGEIRVEVSREAEMVARKAALEALRQREQDKEEEDERRGKRIERYLRLVAGVLAVTGLGWVATVARACVVQEEMARAAMQQSRELQSVKQEVKALSAPDARR